MLKANLDCPDCDVACKWVNRNGTKDGFGWRCMNKECNRYKSYLSLRFGSFFAKSKISLQCWLHVMYLWCNGVLQGQAANLTGISERTMVDIYNFFREVCVMYFQQHPIQLGGDGVICQIDESQFQSKPKHHRGRQLHADDVWVFGIVDISHTPAVGYMEIVARRDANTLLPIVQRVCHPGTIIHSDQWAAYNQLQNGYGYDHGWVNHTFNFVDPNTGIHTQHIEGYWSKHKQRIKAMKGVRREFLDSYLAEFMWRDRFQANSFHNLVGHITEQFS